MLRWATVATLPGMPDGIREYALLHIGGSDEEWPAGEDADPVASMIASATEHFAAEASHPVPALGRGSRTVDDANLRRDRRAGLSRGWACGRRTRQRSLARRSGADMGEHDALAPHARSKPTPDRSQRLLGCAGTVTYAASQAAPVFSCVVRASVEVDDHLRAHYEHLAHRPAALTPDQSLQKGNHGQPRRPG